MLSKRLYGAALMSAVVIPAVLPACSDENNPLCCNEFKVGATISAEIGGGAQGQVAAQAVADFAGIASAALDDITAACRSMAQDLDASKADQTAAEGKGDRQEKMKAWCSLAVGAIGRVKAGATINIDFQPPKCEASISAKANCQAKCSVDGKCDIKANPPKCEGGSLEVACKGECKAKAGATLTCTGKCEGKCKGSCSAKGGVAVKCNGKCEGKCSANADGSGNGFNAEGECTGYCDAKCTASATAPAAECSGSCEGECDASCTGTAEASVKCDGECTADYEPLQCKGGTLSGGCKVDAKCDANCDASVSAKAECSPPSLVVNISGGANAEMIAKLKATIEANLGVVLAFKARLEGMGKIAASFSGNINAVTDLKPACIPAIVSATADAVDNVKASGEATASLAGAVGIK